MMEPAHEGFAARIVASALRGLASVVAIPREEEPRIIVPMVDVMVSAPGASPRAMEKRIASPMEQFVETIYAWLDEFEQHRQVLPQPARRGGFPPQRGRGDSSGGAAATHRLRGDAQPLATV